MRNTYVKACCQIEVIKSSENEIEWIKFSKMAAYEIKTNLIKWKVNLPKFGEKCPM